MAKYRPGFHLVEVIFYRTIFYSAFVLVAVEFTRTLKGGFFMKRANNLFEKIIDYQNLRLAFLKALKRRRSSSAAILFCQSIERNLWRIQKRLLSGNPNFGDYRQFKVFDPKERVITAASFEERVMHHAIMNVLEPIFEKQFVYHTYACRKDKGMHKAVEYAQRQCRKYKYFLKLDVKKYFESIDHEVLKWMLCKIIKDRKCLFLLFDIIDSFYPGLPIGNLTSQFFANLYLSSLDHFIIEELKVPLVRYMDDFIIWGSSIEDLKRIFCRIKIECEEALLLSLKSPVFGLCCNGAPFLGCLILPQRITLLRKNRLRRIHKIWKIHHQVERGIVSEYEANIRSSVLF